MATSTPHVVEADEQNFGTVVLEESKRRPVIVDFWAAWCQPCRVIGPVLERLAAEHDGRFLLAKVDVDRNQMLAQALGIQGIPAVKAFRDRGVVDEFVGAVPEQSIRDFLKRLMPTEADDLVEQGLAAERRGDVEGAERGFHAALEADPRHAGATLGLARLAASRGDLAKARRLLEPLRPSQDAERLLAAIDVSEWAGAQVDGPLGVAARAAAEGRWQEALEVFLAAVRNGTEQDRDRARDAMIKVFWVLGEEDPLTREYRRKLSAALF